MSRKAAALRAPSISSQLSRRPAVTCSDLLYELRVLHDCLHSADAADLQAARYITENLLSLLKRSPHARLV